MHSASAGCAARAGRSAGASGACASALPGRTGFTGGAGCCLCRQGGRRRRRPDFLLAVVLRRHLPYLAEQFFADAVAWGSVFSVVIHNCAYSFLGICVFARRILQRGRHKWGLKTSYLQYAATLFSNFLPFLFYAFLLQSGKPLSIQYMPTFLYRTCIAERCSLENSVVLW